MDKEQHPMFVREGSSGRIAEHIFEVQGGGSVHRFALTPVSEQGRRWAEQSGWKGHEVTTYPYPGQPNDEQ